MSGVVYPPCKWCGVSHGPRCPSVAAIEYHPDGTVRRVEFVPPLAPALFQLPAKPATGVPDNIRAMSADVSLVNPNAFVQN